MKPSNYIILFCFTLLVSCVKPYDFDPQSYEKVLVIDGLITDQPGPYSVKISYTYPLDNVLNEFVKDAEVWVEDGDGTRIDYSWSESGNYLSPDDFVGEVGQTYRLFIQLPEGTYASSEEILTKSPEIDSIYQKYAVLPTVDGDRNTGGIQFFIDSHDDTGSAKYYRYEWEEGYKIRVPYPASHEVKITEQDTLLVLLEEEIGICYEENFSNKLIYGTTVGSSENRMAEFPVRFVSQEEQTLRVRYSILVRQYAITESAYLFYKRLRENNESGGSLFDRQTGSVFGNISSVDNRDQAVLGYFEASGVSSKRAFFSHRDFDKKLNVADFPYYCGSNEIIESSRDSVFYYLRITSGNVFAHNTMPVEVFFIHYRKCTDCSYYADTTPPDYWID